MLKIYKQHTFASFWVFSRCGKAGVGLRPCLCTALLEGQVGREPEATAFLYDASGGLPEVGVISAISDTVDGAIRVGVVRFALVELLIQQVVDGCIQSQVLSGPERAPQVQQGIGVGVASQSVPDRLVGSLVPTVVHIVVLGCETRSLATVFRLQPQVQRVGGLPVQFGISEVHRSVGQRCTFIFTAPLLAIGVGIVATQGPG